MKRYKGKAFTALLVAITCLHFAAALLGSGSEEDAQAIIPWVKEMGGKV